MERKLTGKEEALLVVTACARPPKGPCPLDVQAAGRCDSQAGRPPPKNQRTGGPLRTVTRKGMGRAHIQKLNGIYYVK